MNALFFFFFFFVCPFLVFYLFIYLFIYLLSVAIFLQHLRDNFLFSILAKKLWFKHSDFFSLPQATPIRLPIRGPYWGIDLQGEF